MFAVFTLALAHAAAPDLSVGIREDTYPTGSVETAVRALGPQLLACFPDVATPPVAAAVDIGKDGVVTAATVPVVKGSAEEVCALGALRGLHLPVRSAPTTLVLLLQPSAAAGAAPELRFQLSVSALGTDVSQFLSTDGEGIGGLTGVRGTGSGAPTSASQVPGGQLTLAPPVIRGALDAAVVEAVVKRSASRLKYCFLREMGKNRTVGGTLDEDVLIAVDGSVSSAVTRSSTLENASIETCVSGQFLKMVFPAPTDGTAVKMTYSLAFTPG